MFDKVSPKPYNQYFFDLLKPTNQNETLEHLSYWTTEKSVLNIGENNLLKNVIDSVTVLNTILRFDSIFSLKYLIDLIKYDKAILYDYYNPIIKYDYSNINSLILYPNADTFTNILNNGKTFRIITGNYGNDAVSYDQEPPTFYHVFLSINKKEDSITQIKLKGIMPFLSIYSGITGDYLGLQGIGCFIFKDNLILQ